MLLSLLSLTAENRYALIIGNSEYADFGSLQEQPVNDAADISASLKQLGFEVTTLQNASLRDMKNATRVFRSRLHDDAEAVGLFYYAGHGLQHDGENYLIPSDAVIPDAVELEYEGYKVSYLMDQISAAGNQLNMVILDACRDFPAAWTRSVSRGLTVVGNRPAGSLIMFATSEGDVADNGSGRNGLFTSVLLEHLQTTGIDVEEVFERTAAGVQEKSNGKQIPEVYDKFTGDVYLAGIVNQQEKDVPGWFNNPPWFDDAISGVGKHNSDELGAAILLSLVHSLCDISNLMNAKVDSKITDYTTEEDGEIQFVEAITKMTSETSLGSINIQAQETDYFQEASSLKGTQTLSIKEKTAQVVFSSSGTVYQILSVSQDSEEKGEPKHVDAFEVNPELSPRDCYKLLLALVEDAGGEVQKYIAGDKTVYAMVTVDKNSLTVPEPETP